MFRTREDSLEVFLVHFGGPFWVRKDLGSWSVPKGEIEEGEASLDAAIREFEEETGIRPAGPYHELTPVRQRAGKTVHAWAFEGDADPRAIRSNTFLLEWPPKSGRKREFPEIDRAAWFGLEEGKRKIQDAQRGLLEDLERLRGLRH